MASLRLKAEVIILAIADIILLILIISSLLSLQNPKYEYKPTIIKGKIIYLSNISNPEDALIGVWLKIELDNPKYAKFGEEGYAGFLIITNNTAGVGIPLKNVTGNEKEGFIVDVEDKNNNGVIDTGDVFHIYGHSLRGYDVMFCINGISGNIHTHIPESDCESSVKEEKYDIKDALDDIGSKITIHDSLMVVIITHGGSGGFGVRTNVSVENAEETPSSQGVSVSYSDLGKYLNKIFGNGNSRKYAVMIIVNQACFSGTMINHLYGENRILISAAD